jgi:hypothetical protein
VISDCFLVERLVEVASGASPGGIGAAQIAVVSGTDHNSLIDGIVM